MSLLVKYDGMTISPCRMERNEEYGFVRTSARVVVPSVYSKVIFPDVPADSVEASICKLKYEVDGTSITCPSITTLSLPFWYPGKMYEMFVFEET